MPRTAAREAASPQGAGSHDSVPWHALSVEEALGRSGVGRDGLSEAEAGSRLARFGPNRLETVPPPSAWSILLRQLKSVVVALLFGAAMVALLVGDAVEALAIGAVLAINTALGFWSEWKARKAMEALGRLQAQQATVRRGGSGRQVAAEMLVPGDVIVLEEGASVPADARLLEAHELRAVEAPLTGESLPVSKGVDPVSEDEPL
ncbi:MAG: cation-transporting P-type ATPase, partial [Holophagales bacterium]|nr:cation-transporting P-type ATPase [Holophagales bacterium]